MLNAIKHLRNKDAAGLLARTSLALAAVSANGIAPTSYLDNEETLRQEVLVELRQRLSIDPEDNTEQALFALKRELRREIEAIAEPINRAEAELRLRRRDLPGLWEDQSPYDDNEPISNPDAFGEASDDLVQSVNVELGSAKLDDVNKEQIAILLDIRNNRLKKHQLANGDATNIRKLFSIGYLDQTNLGKKGIQISDLLSDRAIALLQRLENFRKNKQRSVKGSLLSDSRNMHLFQKLGHPPVERRI